MRLQLFSLLAALAPFALADVEFTSPAAGASVAAGAITISWKDSGVSPPLSELTPQTLQLVVGGNEVGTNTVRSRIVGLPWRRLDISDEHVERDRTRKSLC